MTMHINDVRLKLADWYLQFSNTTYEEERRAILLDFINLCKAAKLDFLQEFDKLSGDYWADYYKRWS